MMLTLAELPAAVDRLTWDFSCNLGTLMQVGVAFGFGWLMWRLQDRYLKLQNKYIEIMEFLQNVEAKRERDTNYKTKLDIYYDARSVALASASCDIDSSDMRKATYVKTAAHMFFDERTAIIIDDICTSVLNIKNEEQKASREGHYEKWRKLNRESMINKIEELRDSAMAYDGLLGMEEYQKIRNENAKGQPRE